MLVWPLGSQNIYNSFKSFCHFWYDGRFRYLHSLRGSIIDLVSVISANISPYRQNELCDIICEDLFCLLFFWDYKRANIAVND